MPTNKNFLHRIEIVNECLRNTMTRWTLSTLLDAVNEKLEDRYGLSVARRTLQDDLQQMKVHKGAPIESVREGRVTYLRYTDPQFSLQQVALSEEEINLLSDAIAVLRQLQKLKIIDDIEPVIAKLQQTHHAQDTGATTIEFEHQTLAAGSELVDNIHTAIRQKLSLRIRYRSFRSGEDSNFVFFPYLLKEYRNRWFVVGAKSGSTEIVLLAVDRVRQIRNSAVPFERTPGFDPDSYFRHVVGVSVPRKRAPEKLRIKVTATQAPYILSKPIHHSQRLLQMYGNGQCEVELTIIPNSELFSVLLGYGADIEVIEPIIVRDKIRNVLKKAAMRYE